MAARSNAAGSARPSPRRLDRCASIADLRDLARRRLPSALFDFVDGGAGAEETLRANVAAFRAWDLVPKVAVDVAERSSAVTIVSRPSRMPLAIAPTGLAGLLYPDGEIAMARAAAEAGIPYCLSTNSVVSLEELARAVPDADRWFQVYFLKDRAWLDALVARAWQAGYRTLCVTVDLPLAGRRERDIRNAFTVPVRPTLSNALDLARRWSWLAGARRTRFRFGNFESLAAATPFVSIAQHVANLFDPSATWDDVARLRDEWKGKLVVKGILSAGDASRAIALGADAVIVSNHGGRQLDGSRPALVALTDIKASVGDGAELILDSGIRRGTDIVKAIALGASSCMVGRAALYGLAAAGQPGVARAIDILSAELDNALALCGVTSIAGLAEMELKPSALF
jgi:isopentenyl diphosphate isomerase/L-lactate dehydrogenase-like FMN-dependent dehydrogenase